MYITCLFGLSLVHSSPKNLRCLSYDALPSPVGMNGMGKLYIVHAIIGCTRRPPLRLALMSNLIQLVYLQRVIGEQLIHRQPTERKVLIYTFMARSYWGRKQSALCEGVQLLYEPTYQNSSLSWSHMYQGMNRKEPIMNGSEIELQVTTPVLQGIPCSSTPLVEEQLNSTTLLIGVNNNNYSHQLCKPSITKINVFDNNNYWVHHALQYLQCSSMMVSKLKTWVHYYKQVNHFHELDLI